MKFRWMFSDILHELDLNRGAYIVELSVIVLDCFVVQTETVVILAIR